jgi:integrase
MAYPSDSSCVVCVFCVGLSLVITFLLMGELAVIETATAVTYVELSDSARARLRAARPDSTRRSYRTDLRRFLDFATGRGLIPAGLLPAPSAPARDVTEEHLGAALVVLLRTTAGVGPLVAEWVNSLAEAGKAAATIERALAAVSTAHKAAGAGRLDTETARKILTAYKREQATGGRRTRKAAPVTVAILRTMLAALDNTTTAGVRDRALLLLGFAMGARRSELAALDIADLTETAEGYEVLVRISKTDHESAGRTVAVPYGSNPATCPVRALQAWLALLAEHGRTSGPLFLRVDRHGVLGRAPSGRGSTDGRLTGEAVAAVVRRAALAAGLDPDALWSGHSLRRGLATEARRAGHDQVRIGRHGGWVDGSRALAGYFEEADRWTGNPLVGIGL